MDDSPRLPAMIFGGVLILFGVISLFLISRLNEQKIARCTEETKAVVVKVKEKGSAEDKSLEYITDIEYTVDEEVYSNRYTLTKDLGTGSKIDMKYNPKDATEYYIKGVDTVGNKSRIIGIIAIAAGLAVMAIAGGVITTRTFGD